MYSIYIHDLGFKLCKFSFNEIEYYIISCMYLLEMSYI